MAKLFLTSSFYKVKDRLCELVPNPEGLTVAFIPTGADMYTDRPWLDLDRAALVDMGFNVFDFDLKGKSKTEVYDALNVADIIFGAGGNTFYLLHQVHLSGFDIVLPTLLDLGKVYIGSSTRSVIVGPNVEPVNTLDGPAAAPELTSYEGLSLVPFVLLPHYGNLKYEERYQSILKDWFSKFDLRTLSEEQAIIMKGTTAYVV